MLSLLSLTSSSYEIVTAWFHASVKVRLDRVDAVIGAFAMRGAGGSSNYVNGRRRDWMREMEEGAGYGFDEAILREIGGFTG